MSDLADKRRSSVASFYEISEAFVGADVQNVNDFKIQYAFEEEFDQAPLPPVESTLSHQTIQPPKLNNIPDLLTVLIMPYLELRFIG